MSGRVLRTDGPFFDELEIGQVVVAPAVTLTEGMAAVHLAILGDRSPVILDADLGRAVFGTAKPPASPSLVIDMCISGSSVITRRVKGNLFYRGLQLQRIPALGDTLQTTTEVVALRQNRPKPGRASTGLAVLRIRVHDRRGNLVMDFTRCPMLPLRDPEGTTEHADDLEAAGRAVDEEALSELAGSWDLAPLREAVPGPYASDLQVGDRMNVEDADVVSCAPELARLSLNVAAAHHDRRVNAHGKRLVYGGHTIGLAAHQAHRSLPALACIPAWFSCDHLGPVFEDDDLTSEIEIEALSPLPGGGAIARMRSLVHAWRGSDQLSVLDWRFAAVIA